MLKLFGGKSGSKQVYKLYKGLVKKTGLDLGESLGTKFEIVPTSKKVCKTTSVQEEAANSLNTAEFLKSVYSLMHRKGYRLPKIYLDESKLPREYNLSGLQMGNWNIFGPGRLDVTTPSLVIHELGHFLHSKNMVWNQPLYLMFCSFRNLFRPFLNKKEKLILLQDIRRACNQGFFKDSELKNCLKKGYVDEKTLREYYKDPASLLVLNMYSNVSEFIADYFALAARGFKFSPQIAKRYKAFHGPEIKQIVTREETDALMQYKHKLMDRKTIDLKW